MQSKIRIGTSGWSYKEWENIFYPDSETPKLTYYSGTFQTAEIDSTFYANPTRGLVFGWLRNTPKDFQFSAKLPQTITHKKDLANEIQQRTLREVHENLEKTSRSLRNTNSFPETGISNAQRLTQQKVE
jgi:uncharacterized protein YecE (DUF72 family)